MKDWMISSRQVLVLMEAQANLDNVSITYKNLAEKPIYVLGESNQLKQVFINIIKNAVESIPKGENGRVAITLHEHGTDAHVIVKDNGVGWSRKESNISESRFTRRKKKGRVLVLLFVKKSSNDIKDIYTLKVKNKKERQWKSAYP